MVLPEITFLRPDAAWTALWVALAIAVWFLLRRRRFLAFSAVRSVRSLRHHPSPVRRLPTLLLALAIGFICVALLEPVLPFTESRIEAQGLDIVLVLDLSSSMAELMYTGDAPEMRLEVTKRALVDFIRRRRDDRIGLVVFSDNSYVISPLTFDYDYLVNYVEQIDDTLLRMEGMTAIGEGIHMANIILARQSEPNIKNKVLVILTDGEHNAGRDPIEALRLSDAAGIRAHLIGVDLAYSIKEKPAVMALISTITQHGGQYFEANSEKEMQAANAALATLEKGRLAGRRLERNEPIFSWFVLPALVLIVTAFGLRALPYFSDFT